VALDLASPNLGRVTDVVACPGLDYCSLANARSINIAEIVQARFRELEHEAELGELTLNVSGCINACGHHHVGNIGILGIDKQGVEHYQLMLGGASDNDASLGQVLGRAFTEDEIGDAIEKVLRAYLALRSAPSEKFIETYRRLGAEPFKEAVYADHPGPAGVRGRVQLSERGSAAAGGK
jgi:sulfite reductase (NADPH) hemoprotein beta-component